MDSQQLKQSIDRIEECADQAKAQAASMPQNLRECVNDLHQQARQAKQSAQGQADENALRQSGMQMEQMEQTADRAMQACRQAGGTLSPQAQNAVQQAHDEVSRLKKQMQAGSPA